VYLCLQGTKCFYNNLEKDCIDQDIEICKLKVKLNTIYVCIIAIYRAPSGNFNQFINKLDTLQKT